MACAATALARVHTRRDARRSCGKRPSCRRGARGGGGGGLRHSALLEDWEALTYSRPCSSNIPCRSSCSPSPATPLGAACASVTRTRTRRSPWPRAAPPCWSPRRPSRRRRARACAKLPWWQASQLSLKANVQNHLYRTPRPRGGIARTAQNISHERQHRRAVSCLRLEARLQWCRSLERALGGWVGGRRSRQRSRRPASHAGQQDRRNNG